MKVQLRDGIGIALIVAFVGALGVLFWKAIPESNEQLIVYMLGQLSGFVGGVVSYHYVTKAGEKELEQARAENTKAGFAAVSAVAAAVPKKPDVAAADAAAQVAGAAVDEAEQIAEQGT